MAFQRFRGSQSTRVMWLKLKNSSADNLIKVLVVRNECGFEMLLFIFQVHRGTPYVLRVYIYHLLLFTLPFSTVGPHK